jgi:hypothetical protein
VFNDQRDGAVFGPKDMPNAVDMTHMSHHGYESIDSQNVTLAQVWAVTLLAGCPLGALRTARFGLIIHGKGGRGCGCSLTS